MNMVNNPQVQENEKKTHTEYLCSNVTTLGSSLLGCNSFALFYFGSAWNQNC